MMAYTLRNVDLQIGIFYFVEIYKESTIINTIFFKGINTIGKWLILH